MMQQAIRILFKGLGSIVLIPSSLVFRKAPAPANDGSPAEEAPAAAPTSEPGKIRLWLWGLVTYSLVLFVLLLLIKIAFSGKALNEHALAAGQKMIISVANSSTDKSKTDTEKSDTGSEKPSLTPQETIPGVEGLNAAPLESLTEKTDKGVLPVIGSDGTLPWKYYARPYAQKAKTPIVAIVFTNVGLNRPLTEKILALPHNFTLAFSPYASDAGKWAAKSRAEGFESLADLPMQAENYPFSDPGQFGLLEDSSPEENIAHIHSILEHFPAYIGMLASADEKMTSSRDEMNPYLLELKKRGMLFVYVKTPKNAALEEWAKTNAFYILGADKVIDEDPSRTAVDTQLQALTELAKKQGYAIGIAHSYPSTVAALQMWLETLQTQGIDLAPLSAVATKTLQ